MFVNSAARCSDKVVAVVSTYGGAAGRGGLGASADALGTGGGFGSERADGADGMGRA